MPPIDQESECQMFDHLAMIVVGAMVVVALLMMEEVGSMHSRCLSFE